MLFIFTSVMRGLKVYPENMRHNIELTQGLVFSQRVLLALIDKGLTREEAYKMVQDNAMEAWRGKKSFLALLLMDKRITNYLTEDELKCLFNYDYYLKYVDAVFERLGLTKTKRKRKSGKAGSTELAPRAV
jgi:adenylosuccinate lyase